MHGQRLGQWAGLWCTSTEMAENMLHVSDLGEAPITDLALYEGAIVRDKELSNVVFEVFLYDPAGRWFLIPV